MSRAGPLTGTGRVAGGVVARRGGEELICAHSHVNAHFRDRTVLTAADIEVLLGDAGWRGAFPSIEPGTDPERAHRAGFVTALTA